MIDPIYCERVVMHIIKLDYYFLVRCDVSDDDLHCVLGAHSVLGEAHSPAMVLVFAILH